MTRDGRGNPGRIVLHNQPKLTLAALLRRRRTTLKNFVNELGFSTHAALEIWCTRTGIVSPTLEEFEAVFPPSLAQKINSPREGVVVLEAPRVVDEITGNVIDPDAPIEPGIEVVTSARNALVDLSKPSEGTQKKSKPKKDDSPSKE